MNVPSAIKVRLVIPGADIEPMRSHIKHPKIHGEHFAYNGRTGEVLCGAGDGGAWVQFDGEREHSYVGVPVAWLEFI